MHDPLPLRIRHILNRPLPLLPRAIEEHLPLLVQLIELLIDAMHKDFDLVRESGRPADVLAAHKDAWYHEPGSHTCKMGLFKLLRELLCIIDCRGEGGTMACAWEREHRQLG